MPVLDFSRRVGYVNSGGRGLSMGAVTEAVRSALWPGTVLPPAQVLGALVFPVVEFTGAHARAADGQGPMRCLSTLESWESALPGSTPAAPLRIVGFVAGASGWTSAIRDVRSLAGLGAGMVLHRRRPKNLQLLDADATGVWVSGFDGAAERPSLWVTGRVGALSSARRVAVTRLMEEGMFAHALDHDLVS